MVTPNLEFGTNQSTNLSTLERSEFSDIVNRVFIMQSEIKTAGPSVFDLWKKYPMAANSGSKVFLQEQDRDSFASLVSEQGRHPDARSGSGYSVELSLRRFAIKVSVSELERETNKYRDVYQKIVSVMDYIYKRDELDKTHRLTFGASETYTDMDGNTVNIKVGDTKSLFNTAHTLAFSTETYSNRLSTDPRFSQGALELMLDKIKLNDVDNFNKPRGANNNCTMYVCICNFNHTLERNLDQLIRSTTDPDQDNEGVYNQYQNKVKKMVLTYLATNAAGEYDSTKKEYWFTIAANPSKMNIDSRGWEAYAVELMKKYRSWEDEDTVTWYYGADQYRDEAVLNGKGACASFAS